MASEAINPSSTTKDNIQVVIRVRPFNSREQATGPKKCYLDISDCSKTEENSKSILLDTKPEAKRYNYDWVADQETNQAQIFERVGKPLVMTCIEGYNCTIFAYGQTGAGKTYTMQGNGLDFLTEEFSDETLVNRGLQPRVLDSLFKEIQAKDTPSSETEYLVKCSYYEIYNEQIMDLLNPTSGNLQVREDFKKGIFVDNLTEEVVSNSESAVNLLIKGARNRHVGATNMNIESSRSHSVFSLTLESKSEKDGITNFKTSMFHFVDLAGSERQKLTATVGERLKEASNINKSLTVLGSVINSLVEIAEGKKVHIRYRDSKLTFLLKDSLGGNSKTSIIANISPSSCSFSETLSTLKFAQRAKLIKNRAEINEEASGNIEALKLEISRLERELRVIKEDNGISEFSQYRCSGKNLPMMKDFIVKHEDSRMKIENFPVKFEGDCNPEEKNIFN